VSALDLFLRNAISDCIEGRVWPDDIGICDLCGSEHGDRRRVKVNGDPAWICAACVEAHAS